MLISITYKSIAVAIQAAVARLPASSAASSVTASPSPTPPQQSRATSLVVPPGSLQPGIAGALVIAGPQTFPSSTPSTQVSAAVAQGASMLATTPPGQMVISQQADYYYSLEAYFSGKATYSMRKFDIIHFNKWFF